jgi:crossover junction endodeoxyribonuclease RuvC
VAEAGGQLNRKPFSGLVLGIDPSLRGTGLAVVEFVPRGPSKLRFSQTVKIKPKLAQSLCLAGIFRAVSAIVDEFEIDQVAVEQTIFVQNLKTAMNLGAARGAAIAAVAVAGLTVYEYPPLRIKQAVVGFGRASKEQVARTVKSLLELQSVLKFDEADAAAVALCHAYNHRGA